MDIDASVCAYVCVHPRVCVRVSTWRQLTVTHRVSHHVCLSFESVHIHAHTHRHHQTIVKECVCIAHSRHTRVRLDRTHLSDTFSCVSSMLLAYSLRITSSAIYAPAQNCQMHVFMHRRMDVDAQYVQGHTNI
jgi:hypothetical protein